MEASFWHGRWERNDIGFHEEEVNPLLVSNIGKLSLAAGSRVFVPLCGKTRDISWLLGHGYRVAGAELSGLAVDQLFADLGMEPQISTTGELQHYQAPGIDIFVGNIFDLSSNLLGHIDAIYDRAALVALPETLRVQYASHLMALTSNAPQLLICYVYDQALMDGPPFSVPNESVNRYYKARYDLTLLSSEDLPGGLKDKYKALENVWLLKKKAV
ncbi:MAG: thiopurine S-methyltransferase [Candidatus Methylacidiphilales bacterium]